MAKRRGLTINACEFLDIDKTHLSIGREVKAALIYGNRLGGLARISNDAGAAMKFELNNEV